MGCFLPRDAQALFSPIQHHHFLSQTAPSSHFVQRTNYCVLPEVSVQLVVCYVSLIRPDITVMVDWALKINYLRFIELLAWRLSRGEGKWPTGQLLMTSSHENNQLFSMNFKNQHI